MAIAEQPREKTAEEIRAEIRRAKHPRAFAAMLGPAPEPGDNEDLEEFLGYLHTHRRGVQIPAAEEGV